MIELQRKLIGDTVRNAAFERALKKAVKPGHHVIDLGSGTGFLGFLASRLGAKSVTMIEGGDILDISKKLALRNGIKNCTFIKKHSTEVRGIPKCDVLVSETLGNYALEENIIESIEDAKRFLKPGAVIIPGKITQFIWPNIDIFLETIRRNRADELCDLAWNNDCAGLQEALRVFDGFDNIFLERVVTERLRDEYVTLRDPSYLRGMFLDERAIFDAVSEGELLTDIQNITTLDHRDALRPKTRGEKSKKTRS
jgi:SAM-dependent methyltransferase